jgi:hypothetical protein
MFEAIGPRITIVMAFAGVLAAALAFVGVRLSATPETAQPG